MTLLKKRVPKVLPKIVEALDELNDLAEGVLAVPKPVTPEVKQQTAEALRRLGASKMLGVKSNGTTGKATEGETVREGLSEDQPGAKAPKPVISGKRPTEADRPRPAYQREDFPEDEGQITMLAMRSMSFTERHELWKKLQTSEAFVTLLKPEELPRRVQREYPAGTAPNKEAIFCCYCAEWQKFRLYSYTGYTKCCGCGMSTRDYYICAANKLWNRGD